MAFLGIGEKKRAIPLIAFSNPTSRIAEQFRLVRTNIQYSSENKGISSIMVASADPGEGKSTVAANLAIVFAQQRHKTLLIDADLRKPSVHFTFRTENKHGLADILMDNVPFRKAVTPTRIPNLSLLTSGSVLSNYPELVSLQEMDDLLKNLKREFDYIIFDTPPILEAADGQIIGNKCDGVIFVLDRGKTRKKKAQMAIQMLENTGSNILGVIVNRIKMNKRGKYSYGNL